MARDWRFAKPSLTIKTNSFNSINTVYAISRPCIELNPDQLGLLLLLLTTRAKRYQQQNKGESRSPSVSRLFFSKATPCWKWETVVPQREVGRSMRRVEVLMNCRAGAPAGICPSKAPSFLGERPRNLARPLLLQIGHHRKKWAFSFKPSRFSPLILAHKARVQHSLDSLITELPSISSSSAYSPSNGCSHTLACAFCGTLSGFPRQFHLPLARHNLPQGHQSLSIWSKVQKKKTLLNHHTIIINSVILLPGTRYQVRA